jgi:hypothetical protein
MDGCLSGKEGTPNMGVMQMQRRLESRALRVLSYDLGKKEGLRRLEPSPIQQKIRERDFFGVLMDGKVVLGDWGG